MSSLFKQDVYAKIPSLQAKLNLNLPYGCVARNDEDGTLLVVVTGQGKKLAKKFDPTNIGWINGIPIQHYTSVCGYDGCCGKFKDVRDMCELCRMNLCWACWNRGGIVECKKCRRRICRNGPLGSYKSCAIPIQSSWALGVYREFLCTLCHKEGSGA